MLRFIRFWTLLCIAAVLTNKEQGIDLPSVFLSPSPPPPHLLHVTSGRMANCNSSNVIIQGGIFSSGHGGLTIINNGDPEFGMHDFMSVLKWTYLDDPMKDSIP